MLSTDINLILNIHVPLSYKLKKKKYQILHDNNM